MIVLQHILKNLLWSIEWLFVHLQEEILVDGCPKNEKAVETFLSLIDFNWHNGTQTFVITQEGGHQALPSRHTIWL